MTTLTNLDPAHRLIHARSAAVLQLVQPLGSRDDILDALAYLIGYEVGGSGGDVEKEVERATTLIRLGYNTSARR